MTDLSDNAAYASSYADACRAAGLPDAFAAPDTAEKMRLLTERLITSNKQFNLTAITEPDEVLIKHVVDSLFAASLIAERGDRGTLLDVGAGGGFPSLPVAAALPQLSVTAMDATAKKCRYIEETAVLAGLANVTAVNARAEEAAAQYGAAFDFVTARAVARLNVLAELCAPFLRVGGTFLAMKGPGGDEEAAEAARAFRTLGLSAPEIRRYELPRGAGERTLIICRKQRPTPPAYPRPYAKIVKSPL